MADTKRAISVDSLQATTDLLNQLTADAQAIIDTLNQTGGVAPVWTNTNVPPNTVGGYDNINPATDVNGLEFAAAMNTLKGHAQTATEQSHQIAQEVADGVKAIEHTLGIAAS